MDRLSLRNLGLADSQIDSYYTSLYVNTIGFYSRIRGLVDSHTTQLKVRHMSTKHDSKGSLISALWRVYAILFEYAFQTNYKFQVLTVAEDAAAVEARLRKDFDRALAALEQENMASFAEAKRSEEKLRLVGQELKMKDNLLKGLERSLAANIESNEQEVSLRTRFEERINQLHSLNRSTREEADAYASRLQAKEEELRRMLLSKLQVQEQLGQVTVDADTQRRARLVAEDKIVFLEQDLDARAKVAAEV